MINYQNQFANYPKVNTGINWVAGKEGARAFQLMPNSNAMLLDSENDGIFYIKVSDNVGMCSLRMFKYEEIVEESKQINLENYVTKNELQEILKDLKGAINNGKQNIQSNKQSTANINNANNSK